MKETVVCGYCVHKDIWDTVIGEELHHEREPDNGSNRYAVAIKKDGIIIHIKYHKPVPKDCSQCTQVMTTVKTCLLNMCTQFTVIFC